MQQVRVWYSIDTPGEFREKLESFNIILTQNPIDADVHLLYIDESFSKDKFDYALMKECRVKNIVVLVDNNGNRKYIPDDIEPQGVYNIRSKAKVEELLTKLQQTRWETIKPSKRQQGNAVVTKKKNTILADAKKEAEKMQKNAAEQLREAQEEKERILKDAEQRKKEIIAKSHIEATPEDQLCAICCERPKNTIFLHGTSGHKFGCYECSIQCETCPVCREPFDRVYRIYEV